MRIASFTLCLVLIYLTGCSQNEKHNWHHAGKIPIDPKRWYILNNTGLDANQFFDTLIHQQPITGQGKIVEHYEAWYPVADGEQMSIDSILFFDYKGTNEQRLTTVYAILNDWKRVTLAHFLSTRADKWVGPDPQNPDVFALNAPVTNIRYLIINTWGNLPTEIEFYGAYTPPIANVAKAIMHYPLSNYFGVNGFEWDFEDPKNPGRLDPSRLNGIKSFTGFRHYLDWEKIENKEGSYSYNPARNGGWNYDTLYQWCKDNNMEVLVCLKNNPPWMLETYPENQRDNENIPIRFGKDPTDPASYIEQAKAAYQFAARYGSNKNINYNMVKVDSTPRWANDIGNKVKIGLGLITYIECSNETDKWWKGGKAYQTGREYAANISAFYDGNKNKLGPGVGVKNADSNMKVVMAGVAAPTTDYLRGMIDWCKEYRGNKPDGSPDLPWDIINYHYYSCEYAPGTKPSSRYKEEAGVAPELSYTETIARNFLQTAYNNVGGMPVWVTETGYDINQGSPQKAIPILNKPPIITQADWLLRSSLLYSRLGINQLFFYELNDDNGSAIKYGTSGLLTNKARRPAADYIYQTNQLFGAYTYDTTLSTDPIVDRYKYNNTTMYVAYIPDQIGRTATYTLKIGNTDTAYIYTPKVGSETMDLQRKKTKNGSVELLVTETPCFITTIDVIKK